MRSFLLTITGILILMAGAVAQATLKGKVTDASTGKPLAGATVLAGKNAGTTDKDGFFSVTCAGKGQLTISFVGYEAYSKTITSCDENISASLTASNLALNEVEITATSNTNKSILFQPSSITRLTTTELKRGTGLFLDDAINGNVPGVTMNRRAVSSGQQFNIRGYGNGSRGPRGISSNFDGQGYKVYLNGIPVTDAEGITVLDDIDYGSIGNVEVVKGPAGTLYGLAIAGAINLETLKPEPGKTSIGQEVLIGNYGLQRYTTHFQTATDKSSLLLNYGHQKSDGFTIHNASRKDFVNASGDFRVSDKQSISAYIGYSNSYDERSGELTIAQFDNHDYTGNVEYIKRNGHSAVYTMRAGFSHTYRFNKNIANTTSVFGTAFNSNASSAGGWTDKSATNFGVRSTFDTKFVLKNNVVLSGITGVETQRENAQTVGNTMVKNPMDTAATWVYGNPYYWIIGAVTSDLYATSATSSVFTEWTLALPKDISITAGVGFSNMKIGLDDRFYVATTPNRTRRYDTTYGKMFSPHVAINKVFNKQFSVYAAYSRAYKAPVSSYFYIPYTAGQTQAGIVNRSLKAEKGDQFEIGTKGALLSNKLTYQVAAFDAVFSDKMTTVAVPYNSTTTLFTYVINGGKQEHKGIEALVKYTIYQSSKGFVRTIAPFANIAYSDFKYKNYKFQSVGKTVVTPANPVAKDSMLMIDYEGKAVVGVPKVLANAGVDFRFAYGIYGNVNYLYKDGFPFAYNQDRSINTTTSYSLLNAKIGIQHSITRHFDFDLYFGVNNIANTKYPIMVFVNQIPDAYIAAPDKANYYGGLNVKYNF